MPFDDKPQSDYWTTRRENRTQAIQVIVLFVLVLGGFVFLVSGCAGVVTPQPVRADEASFDGNEQNSGILLSTPSGFVVTANFRQRYNALIATYGGDYTPVLKGDQGIVPIGDNQWLITKQAMVNFLEMNAWRKAGLKPRNP